MLSTFGSGISRVGQMFEIYSKEKKQKIAPSKVTSILITTGVNMSSDAVELALQNNIDIVMLDKYGNPVGRFWHARMGSTARIRRAQLLISLSDEGMIPGLKWIISKFENQIDFLTALRTRRARLSAEITSAITEIEKAKNQILEVNGKMDDRRGKIMGIEGMAGRIYWDLFSKLVPPHFTFKGRSRQPARDEFNALLNYGYGVMYGIVERAVVVAGLDPYIGFVHTDHYNKVSLVFDVIEKYRIWVEETILDLFGKKAIKKPMFRKLSNGFTLDVEGKKALIPALNEHLDTQIRYRGRLIRRRDTIQLDLHRFAKELLERT
ncbi:MAG: CRISPR-associated endonuclease Cas1 [Calditrichaceae bacterium]